MGIEEFLGIKQLHGMVSKKQFNQLAFRLLCGLLVMSVMLLIYALLQPSDAFNARARIKTYQEILSIKEFTASWELDKGPLPSGLDNRDWLKTMRESEMKNECRKAFQDETNWSGEIVDGWGTPLRMGIGNDARVHVRSAGPDKIFGTEDDITNH